MPVCKTLFISGSIFLFYSFLFRKEHKANPKHHVVNFGANTGISNARRHLFTYHLGDWVKSCDEQNIRIRGAQAVHAVRKFRNLPEPTPLEADRQEFSKEGFVDAITDFIIGDDQVCKLFICRYSILLTE